MNRRIASKMVLGLLAILGFVVVGGLVAGCEHSGCMMGGMMGGHDDHAASSAAPPVNARCPMMGGKATASLTREYKGQTVGFCCGMCPGQWDKLTDAQKDAHLAKVAPSGT